MKKRWIVVVTCLALMCLLSILAVPVAADIPTDIVDQYWVWFPNFDDGGAPGIWIDYVNNLGVPAPEWLGDGCQLGIYNISQPDHYKNIWIEAKFVTPQTEIPCVTVYDPFQVAYQPVDAWISTNGQIVTWQYTLPWQPCAELIDFGTPDFYNLNGIELVEIGTQCVPVPEPSSLLMLGGGLAMLGNYLRRRRIAK